MRPAGGLVLIRRAHEALVQTVIKDSDKRANTVFVSEHNFRVALNRSRSVSVDNEIKSAGKLVFGFEEVDNLRLVDLDHFENDFTKS